MVAYVEGMGAQKVGENRKAQETPVLPWEAVQEVGKLAYSAHQFTKSTGGHGLQLLMHKPPTIEKLQKALDAAAPNKIQKRLLEKAEMKPALLIQAPAKKGKSIQDFFTAVPTAVPQSV